MCDLKIFWNAFPSFKHLLSHVWIDADACLISRCWDLAQSQPGFKSPQLSGMPFFPHFGLVYREMDRLSDPNAGQAWTESWTAAAGFSMDAFQSLTSGSGHIAALQRQVATATYC